MYYLPLNDIVAKTGISRSTLMDWHYSHGVPAFATKGGHWRMDLDAVKAFASTLTMSPVAPHKPVFDTLLASGACRDFIQQQMSITSNQKRTKQ